MTTIWPRKRRRLSSRPSDASSSRLAAALFCSEADQQSAESVHINEVVRDARWNIQDVARMHGPAEAIAQRLAVHLSRSRPSLSIIFDGDMSHV